MKRITLGITTHNEEASIDRLLGSLVHLDPDFFDVILFDDHSTDNTKEMILDHSLARQSNFRAEFSPINHGTPSVGRTYIGEHAATYYTTLVDGDDFIEPAELEKAASLAPAEYDLILTSYAFQDVRVGLRGAGGDVRFDHRSVSRVLAGIGGKIYRSELLAQFGSDSVKARSDDVRLNMRIMEGGRRRIFHIPEICFYHIEKSRKSTRVSSFNFGEIENRISRYRALAKKYPIRFRYLENLQNHLIEIARSDETISEEESLLFIERINTIFPPASGGGGP